MNQNSIDAYNTIKANGLLSKRRMEVYEAIVKHGKLTQREAARYFAKTHPNNQMDSFTPRFAELHAMDVIHVTGSKKDSVTGHVVDIWTVTGNLPKKLPKKLTTAV